MVEIRQINTRDITPRFQIDINEEIKRFWIGQSYPGSDQPCMSYEESYIEIIGVVPVLITAPHAVPHDRGGEKLKEQDDNTDLVVMETCKNLNCHGLIPLKPIADPNKLCEPTRKSNSPTWKDTNGVPFYSEAERLIKEKSIQFLLDIHGITDDYEDSVVIGTSGVKTKEVWAKGLKEYLDQNGVKTVINSTRALNGERHYFSGGKFVRNISIPGLQLEIKRAYRTCEHVQKLSRFLADFLGSKFERTKSNR